MSCGDRRATRSWRWITWTMGTCGMRCRALAATGATSSSGKTAAEKWRTKSPLACISCMSSGALDICTIGAPLQRSALLLMRGAIAKVWKPPCHQNIVSWSEKPDSLVIGRPSSHCNCFLLEDLPLLMVEAILLTSPFNAHGQSRNILH